MTTQTSNGLKWIVILSACTLLFSSCTTTQVAGTDRLEIINTSVAGGGYVTLGLQGNGAKAINWITDGAAAILAKALAQVGIVRAPTNTPAALPPAVTPPIVVPPPEPQPSYTYVAGNTNDRGREVWIPNFQGMGIRLSANAVDDFRKVGINSVRGSWYPLDSAVIPAGAIILQAAPDGGIIAACTDFTSTRTGAKYHCQGFYLGTTDATSFRPGSSITIPKSQCSKTLRFMLATVKP